MLEKWIAESCLSRHLGKEEREEFFRSSIVEDGLFHLNGICCLDLGLTSLGYRCWKCRKTVCRNFVELLLFREALTEAGREKCFRSNTAVLPSDYEASQCRDFPLRLLKEYFYNGSAQRTQRISSVYV